MDHHCPWINNCVGLYTQKVFLLFNGYGIISLSYSLGLILEQFLEDLYSDHGKIAHTTFAVLLLTLTLIISGLIFMMIVFFDQIVIITNRLSVLEKVRLYSNRLGKRVRKRAYKNFKVTMGGPCSLRWFLPLPFNDIFNVEEFYN